MRSVTGGKQGSKFSALRSLIVTKYHSQSKTVSCQLILPLSQRLWGRSWRRVSIKCIAVTTNLFFSCFYNCFETEQKDFLASFNLEIPSRSTKFLRWKKFRDSWDCWQEKNVLVATARGQGSNWGLLVGLVTQLLITLCCNYPDNWHLSRVQGVTRSGL